MAREWGILLQLITTGYHQASSPPLGPSEPRRTVLIKQTSDLIVSHPPRLLISSDQVGPRDRRPDDAILGSIHVGALADVGGETGDAGLGELLEAIRDNRTQL